MIGKLIIAAVLLLPFPLLAQLTTAVPFLMAAPDAKAVGMGESGVATAPDANALYWNVAKYAFSADKAGISLSYQPWNRAMDKGMNLGAVNAFYRLGERHAVAVGARFFTYGKIEILNDSGELAGSESPKDYSVDAAYSYRFAKYWSAGVAVRYVHSDALAGIADAASAVAADLSVYFNRESRWLGNQVWWRAGLNISNLGTKLSYGEGLDNNYLPANLRLGGAAAMKLCPKHEVELTVELNKYLVPQPKVNGDGIRVLPDKSALGGIGESFSDDFASVAWAFGAGYTWDNWLHVRAGYHLRNKDWGDRRYFTFGAGVEYAGFELDGAYRIPSDSGSPFHNSWCLSLGYRF